MKIKGVTKMLSLYHSPFELLDNFEQQFSQIDRTPLAEVVDTNDKYIIRLELPGVVKETIDVKATDKSLTVSANRKNLDDKESRYLFSEFRYGKWNRTFKFNSNLNQKTIKASYHDGILEIVADKTSSHTTINVKIDT